MKTWGIGGIAPLFFTSTLYLVSGDLHTPSALPPDERTTGVHWVGGWVGPRIDLDVVEKR
jgi:hypothetical protein